jgi:hypothetical protein
VTNQAHDEDPVRSRSSMLASVGLTVVAIVLLVVVLTTVL